jgi:hypothetical protein
VEAERVLPDDWSDLLRIARARGYEIGYQSPEGAPPVGVRYWPINKAGYAAGPVRSLDTVERLRAWLAGQAPVALPLPLFDELDAAA